MAEGDAGSFFERTDELLERVGEGDLTGVTTVESDYAYNQHEGGWKNFMGRYGAKEIENHPGGGGPPPSRFLAAPFEERSEEFMGRFADELLEGDLEAEMAAVQEDLADEVYARAPVRDDVLRNSVGRAVYANGSLVRYRPPGQTG